MDDKQRTEIELLQKRSDYNDRVFKHAIKQIAETDRVLPKLVWNDHDDDDYTKICRILCDYFKVEMKAPVKGSSEDQNNPDNDALYLSGFRQKEVVLGRNWWKSNNGVMIGYFKDGTPMALTPCVFYGYKVFNPKTMQYQRVNKKFASDIQADAIAIFHVFPSKSLKATDIVGFTIRENVYRDVIIILLCSFLANMIGIIPPIIAERIFDFVIPGRLIGALYVFIFVLIFFGIADATISVIINLGVSRIHTRDGFALQAALWDRLLSLRIPFFMKYTTGQLLQKIKSIDKVKQIFSIDNLQAIIVSLFSFVYIIAMFMFDAAITPYVLLMFIFLFLVHIIAWRKKFLYYQKYNTAESMCVSFGHQAIEGMYRIKVSSAGERVFNKWCTYDSEKRYIEKRIKKIDNTTDVFTMFFDYGSVAVVFFLISITGGVEIGMFVAYIATFLLFKSIMKKFISALDVIPEFLSLCSNIKPILDADREYNPAKTIPAHLSGTIEVNNVTFRYSEFGRDILHNISFRIEAGESLGIVGLSGGGKTTLLKALMGFYTLAEGKIYYDGNDLETIDLRYLRKKMGVVIQDGKPAVSEIIDAVKDGDRHISDDEAMDAIRKVGLEELINSLPNGMYTRLEEFPLSDGNNQKLLIARAIAKKNIFLFLDEATNALDNISQNEIFAAIKEIPATKIIVAQRLATVQHCDKVIVIEDGRITMQGTYDEIIHKHALFNAKVQH